MDFEEGPRHFCVQGHDYSLASVRGETVAEFTSRARDQVRLRGRKCPDNLVILDSVGMPVPPPKLVSDLGQGSRDHPIMFLPGFLIPDNKPPTWRNLYGFLS